ncbi:MAG: FMN-binding protein [Bacteroidales bacterium]|jgi:major membrane immunogen (membrane-anchored lipoprotein)|nr:FMN-binding protein [Bacteroidales bacterium]
MKKTLLILVAIVFAVTACEKATYMDGEYSATYSEIDSHGWNAFVNFTLTEDVISGVDFDYLDADGIRKSEDADYNERMLSIMGITNPETYVPQIEAALADATINPQFDSIDAITGATSSSHNATILFKAALDAAIDGEPMDVVLTQPDPMVEE